MFPKNHGDPWYESDDDKLRSMFCDAGCSIEHIAERFGRTEGSIRCRLRHLGLGREVDRYEIEGREASMSRYLILGFRADGSLQRIAGNRGRTPDGVIGAALRLQKQLEMQGNGFPTMLLLTVDNASSTIGMPLNIRAQIIAPMKGYSLIDLKDQGRPHTPSVGSYLDSTRHGY